MRGGGKDIDELKKKMKALGSEEQIDSTIERMKENDTLDKFMDKYPHGTHINPLTIKKILEEYYHDKSKGNSLDKQNNYELPPRSRNAVHDYRVNM